MASVEELAVVGVYGHLAYLAVEQTHDIAILCDCGSLGVALHLFDFNGQLTVFQALEVH